MQRMVKFQKNSILKFLSNNANLKSKVQKSTYKIDFVKFQEISILKFLSNNANSGNI